MKDQLPTTNVPDCPTVSGRCAPPCSMELSVMEKPIFEHPNFKTPRTDWGVIPAREIDEWRDEGTGKHHPSESIPEDRTGWRPEWDGKSIEDFWDHNRGRIIDDAPKQIRG